MPESTDDDTPSETQLKGDSFIREQVTEFCGQPTLSSPFRDIASAVAMSLVTWLQIQYVLSTRERVTSVEHDRKNLQQNISEWYKANSRHVNLENTAENSNRQQISVVTAGW